MEKVDFVQKVHVGFWWTMDILRDFAPSLCYVQNLHELLCNSFVSAFIFVEIQEIGHQFTSQLKVYYLHGIYMDSGTCTLLLQDIP